MIGSLALQTYIGGEHVDARSGRRFDVLNPATGELYDGAGGRHPASAGSFPCTPSMRIPR